MLFTKLLGDFEPLPFSALRPELQYRIHKTLLTKSAFGYPLPLPVLTSFSVALGKFLRGGLGGSSLPHYKDKIEDHSSIFGTKLGSPLH